MKHDKIIDDIVERLYNSHPGSKIETCKDYKIYWKNKIRDGEFDIALYDKPHNLMYLIEVKGRDSHRHRKKAKEQLKKDIKYFTDCGKFCQKYGFYAFTDKRKPRGYNVELIYKR